MKAPSVCAILLWSCWCFGSPAEASLASINVGGDRNPQALLLAEASKFSRQLDEVGVGEHRRFQRSLNGLPMHRVKRSDVTDFRHGFYPGTGVGNREEFEFSSLDRVMSASILNETIIEWGYIEIGINETLVMATTEEALLVFKLDLLKPVEKLSLIKNFSNVMVSEVFTRHSWQAGHIVKTTHYLTTYDSSYFLRHYTLETSNNITLKDSVDLGPISIVDLHYFAFDKVTYLAALTSNGFVRLYRWSSRYCKFSVAEDLTVSVAVSNVQAFDISGAHYLLVSAFGSNSTLFKYHSRQSSFRQYQLLYPDGAKQATYFTDAYEHYLVFINALGQTSTFFKWNGFKFEELQIINTAGANHWLPVPVPGSQDGTLLILSSNGWAPDVLPLTVYKHDPQTGIFQELSETPVSEMLNQPVENRIRLMGGSTYLEGRVEVYRNFTWGTVCDDEWDLQDANVVCRQLGYRAAVSAPGQARFCQGAGPIVYGNVNCLGNESMLHACSLSTSPSNCTHAKDAGVVCAPNGPAQSTYKKFQVENQIRLVGGSSYLDGRVEVYRNGTWGTVCDDSWDLQDADVVCRQLGYGAAVSAPKEALFCHGSGPIVYSNVNCVGNESMLQSCDLLTSHNCVHDEDAGAVCTASHPTESVSCAECHNATSALSFHVGTDVYLLVGVSSYPYSKDPGNFFKMTLRYMATDDPVVVESLQLEAKIDELDNKTNSLNASLAGADKIIANSMTKDGHEEIRGVKTFTEVDIKKAEVENINVDDAYIYAPRPTGNESLGYVVNRSLTQRREIEDFLDFLNNVVTLNTTQTITGAKNITSVTIQGALNTTVFSTRVFDGVNIDELNREAFRLNVPNQVINGELTFSENLTSTESIGLDSGHLVNDVDLSEDVVLITSPQTITGMKTIQQNMSIENDMVLHTGVLLNDIDPSDQLVTLSGSHVITGQLNFTDVIHIDGDIVTDGTIDGVTVNSLCGDVMTKSTNQTVSGPIIFQQPPVFDTDVVYGGLLRQVNITHLADEAVRINQGTKIAGAKTFMDDVSVTGNVIVDGLVTNIDLQQDVVQLAVAGNLTGARVFGGLVEMAGVVNITGTVNGLDLSQDVVTLKGDHAIQGKKTFVDGISAAKNISVTGTVDTVDLSTWASNVMTLSTNQTVQGPLVFTNDTNMGASLNVTGLINGIDLQAMYRDTFFKTSDQVQIISGNKTFMKPLTVTTGHIAIEGLINGLNMTEDYLNKFSDQNVTRQKTFVDGFSADGGLNVSGLIAGNDLLELYGNSLLRGREAHLRGERTFLGNVTVEGVVNVTSMVDGVKIATDVLTIYGNQIVTGAKTFQRLEADNMSVDDMNAVISVNQRNWTDFVLSRVDLTSNQDISVNHSFSAANVTASDVEIKWLVNGINLTAVLEDIMTKNTVQTVTGTKTIPGTMIVHGNVSLNDHINGIQLKEFAARALLLDGPLQTVTGRKTFDNMTILSSHLEVTGLVDGINLDFFMSDIIHPDNLQKILANKTFLDGFHARDDVVVTGTVDGIDLSEDIMTNSTAQNISGNYIISYIVTTDPDMLITGLINGIDLVYLNNSIMKTSEDQTVDAPLVFATNLTSKTDVSVTGLVDGYDLSELDFQAIMLYEPFNLTGNVTFTKDVTFEGPLNTTGLIFGRNLSAWYRDVVLLHTDDVVVGNKTFINDVEVSPVLSVVGNMEADTVFGRDFDSFVADAVNLTGNATITGVKTFLGDVDARADVSVAGTVDGVHIEDIVTKDGNEEITGVKTFMKSIIVNGHINITGFVNGVDISNLYTRTFKLNSPQNVTAPKQFTQSVRVTGDIVVTGLVDGVDLNEEAVTLNTDQTIGGTISFTVPVIVNGNMTVVGFVDGVNLTDLVTERATLTSNESVRGLLTFQGHVTLRRNVTVANLFDGVSLPYLWSLHETLLSWIRVDVENLLLISADQCLAVKHLQRAYANTVEEFSHTSEVQEMEFRIQSFESFVLDDVTHLALAIHSDSVNNLCVDSYVYAWDEDSYEFVQKAAIATNGAYSWHAFRRQGTQYIAIANEGTNPCSGDDSVNNTIYYYNGTHFLEHQGLESSESREIDTTVIDGDLYLALANTKTSALSTLYLQAQDGLFYEAQNFSVGGATAVEFLQAGNTNFLVFAAVSPTQSPVYIFNTQTGQFDFHQYVSTSYAASVASFKFQGNAGLAFANQAQLYANNKVSYDVPIEVYFLSKTTGEFELREMVDFTAAVDVAMFHIGPDLYMAAISEYEELQILKHDGAVGFSQVLTLASYGVVTVEIFEIMGLPEYQNLFFALGVNPVTDDDTSSWIIGERIIGQTVKFEILPCDIVIEDSFHGDTSLLNGPL